MSATPSTSVPTPFRSSDLLLALVVVVVWGVNFVVMKWGLRSLSPFQLGALRYLLAAFPALLFVKPPKVPLRLYLLYGMTMAVGQFALLFTAIHIGMPSGLASLVLQSQSFFTLLLAAWWLREKWQGNQVAGLALAGCGLVLIGSAHGASMPWQALRSRWRQPPCGAAAISSRGPWGGMGP